MQQAEKKEESALKVEDFAESYGDLGCRSCDASGWIDVYRFVPWGPFLKNWSPKPPSKNF